MNEYKDSGTSNIIYFIISLLLALVFAIPFFFSCLFIVISLFPAVTHFKGKDYPVMPTEQVFFSLLLTIIASLILLIIVFRKIKRKYK